MNYVDLEIMVVEKGKRDFIAELNEASKPMIEVLKKYGVTHKHKFLKQITLSYPYDISMNNSVKQTAIDIPKDLDLVELEENILLSFLNKVESLK